MRHYEDLRVGDVMTLGEYTLSEAEILDYGRRYDPQPFHIDPEAARQSIYGGLIASGWHTCAIMMRLSVEAMHREQAAVAGSPGIESCRWVKPVRPGDTLTGRSEIVALWPSKTRPFGFARRRVEMTNQRGEVVLALVGVSMYQRREADGGRR